MRLFFLLVGGAQIAATVEGAAWRCLVCGLALRFVVAHYRKIRRALRQESR